MCFLIISWGVDFHFREVPWLFLSFPLFDGGLAFRGIQTLYWQLNYAKSFSFILSYPCSILFCPALCISAGRLIFMETIGRHKRLTWLLVSNNGKRQQVMESLEERRSGSLLPSPSTAPSTTHRGHSSIQAAFLLQTSLCLCVSATASPPLSLPMGGLLEKYRMSR